MGLPSEVMESRVLVSLEIRGFMLGFVFCVCMLGFCIKVAIN